MVGDRLNDGELGVRASAHPSRLTSVALATAAVTSSRRSGAALYHRVPLLLTAAGAVDGVQVHSDAFFSPADVSRLLPERAWRRDKSRDARRVTGNYNKCRGDCERRPHPPRNLLSAMRRDAFEKVYTRDVSNQIRHFNQQENN